MTLHDSFCKDVCPENILKAPQRSPHAEAPTSRTLRLLVMPALCLPGSKPGPTERLAHCFIEQKLVSKIVNLYMVRTRQCRGPVVELAQQVAHEGLARPPANQHCLRQMLSLFSWVCNIILCLYYRLLWHKRPH